MTGAELADGLQSRIDTARHERSIWNYAAAEGAEKELARFCAEHRDAILAALDADMFGAAERVKRAILTAEWGDGYDRNGSHAAGEYVEYREGLLHLFDAPLAEIWADELAKAALAALPPPAAGDARAEVELAAREKMREFINAMADEYAHEHFVCDPTTGVWEAGNETKESYELGLRDAAGAIARLNCERFGHDWRRWNDITRRCYRCETQEHGEHLRTALAQGQTGDGLAGEGERG